MSRMKRKHRIFTPVPLSDRPTSAFRKTVNQQEAVRAALMDDALSRLMGEIFVAAEI